MTVPSPPSPGRFRLLGDQGFVYYRRHSSQRAAPTTAHKQNVRFGSLADMCSALADVRFVPITDITPLIRSFLRAGEVCVIGNYLALGN